MKNIYFKFKNTAILLLLLISSVSFGQIVQKFDTAGTYTFTVPAGVTSLKVEAWGSGSGGHWDDNHGGGGGAFAANNNVTVIPGINYTVTVGLGGTTGGGKGLNGNFSSFAGLVTALGAQGINGGSANGSIGSTKFDGGKGGTGKTGQFRVGGGGGGSAGAGGPGGNGGNYNGSTGGFGGAAGLAGSGSSGAAGGSGGANENNGEEGYFPGGGGGMRGGGNRRTSGYGADGRIIITYNCPSDAGILSGSQYICTINGTTTFSATLAGGIWSSSNNAIATVSTSGLVIGKSFGTAVITYTIASASCTTRTITREVYVGNKPNIAAISTPATLCSGAPFNPAVPAVTANDLVVTSQGWQLETAVSSGTFAVFTIPYAVNFVDNGKKIRYFATNSCGTTYSNQVNLMVTPLNTASIASSSPSLCNNTTLIPITHTTTGATGIGIPVNLPSGVTASWAANQITISGTPTVKGTFNYSIPLTGGCGNVNATGTIVVNDGVVTTFNGTWDNGIPDITKKAVSCQIMIPQKEVLPPVIVK